jgi:DNA polymerase-3 subunit beta
VVDFDNTLFSEREVTMKVKVQKDLLQKKLANIQSIVDRGGSLQVLNHFLLSALPKKSFITATDLETAYREPLDMEVEEGGAICIPGKKFFEIVREMEDIISIETVDSRWLKVAAGKSNIRLACLPGEDFPIWPDLLGEIEISLTVSLLYQIIERSLYAARDAETRFFLNGLLFKIIPDNTLIVVGTDTHRLAFVKNPVEIKESSALKEARDVLISKKAISEIKKILSESSEIANITIGKNHILIRVNDIELLTRQVEGTFPDFTKAIPESFEKDLILDREVFLKSLRKVSVISKERGYMVKLDVGRDLLTISATDPDYGEAIDEIEADYKSEPFAITFNARYLQEAANAMTSKKVIMKFLDGQKPVMMQQEGLEDYKCVIMPLRS